MEELASYQVIRLYCGCGKMGKFIRERKNGFGFSAVSSSSMIVNANRLQVHVLAHNLFNWFRRLALAANMRKMRADTIRLKLLKVAAKVVYSARYKCFKLCSSCSYKKSSMKHLQTSRSCSQGCADDSNCILAVSKICRKRYRDSLPFFRYNKDNIPWQLCKSIINLACGFHLGLRE